MVELDFGKKEFTAFRRDNTNTNCSQYLHKSADSVYSGLKQSTDNSMEGLAVLSVFCKMLFKQHLMSFLLTSK